MSKNNMTEYYKRLIWKNNFLNAQNYYKNNETKKKYLTHLLAQKFTNTVEKVFIILFWVVLNILYVYFLFSQKEELFDWTISDLIASWIIILWSLWILNGLFYYFHKVGIKKMFLSQVKQLHTIYISRDFLLSIFFLYLILEIVVLWFSLIIFLLKFSLNEQILDSIIDLNLLFVVPFVLLLSVTSRKNVPKYKTWINLLTRIFLLVLFTLLLWLRIIILFLSKCFVYIFFPLIKILFNKKLFYNIAISWKEVIELENKFIITK